MELGVSDEEEEEEEARLELDAPGVGTATSNGQASLRSAWEAARHSTRADWHEWMRGLSVEMLRQSPSPALRTCASLAQAYQPLARELFNAAFLSCWSELGAQGYQESLVASLDGFGSPWSGAFETDSFAPELGDSEPGSLLGAGAEGVAPSFSAALSTIDPLWSRTPPDGKRAADSGLRARVIGSVSAALSESS